MTVLEPQEKNSLHILTFRLYRRRNFYLLNKNDLVTENAVFRRKMCKIIGETNCQNVHCCVDENRPRYGNVRDII